jgi:putative zinc finger/helix-turn-helix YgiT family protein
MKKIIESPFADCNAVLNITPQKMTFRKEEFDVFEYYYICEKTKKEFTTPEATDLTLKHLYNQYREKNNILFPEQIKQLREQYKLSPVKMSEVLGFGENVYRQYEKGEIPSKSNAKTLNLIKHSKNFIELAEKSNIFSEYEINNLKEFTAKNEVK